MPSRVSRCLLALGAGLGCFAASPALAQNVFGVELVVNGGAEAGPASPNGIMPVPAIPGWTFFDGVNVLWYGTPGGFPTQASPGPSPRGSNFFAGGNDSAFSTASQIIGVAAGASQIDSGESRYSLSAFLGGMGNQDDSAQLTLLFNDASGTSIGTASLAGPLGMQRGGVTGLFERSTSDEIPVGTRSITVVMAMVRAAGVYNDGYADNISLILTPPPPSCDPDFNADGNVDQDDVICVINTVAGNPGCSTRDPDFNADGNVDQEDVVSMINVVAGGPCP